MIRLWVSPLEGRFRKARSYVRWMGEQTNLWSYIPDRPVEWMSHTSCEKIAKNKTENGPQSRVIWVENKHNGNRVVGNTFTTEGSPKIKTTITTELGSQQRLQTRSTLLWFRQPRAPHPFNFQLKRRIRLKIFQISSLSPESALMHTFGSLGEN